MREPKVRRDDLNGERNGQYCEDAGRDIEGRLNKDCGGSTLGCTACPTNDWHRERFAARELLDMAPEDPVESPEVHLGRRHSAVQKWARLSDLGCREHYSWFETPIPWLKSRSGLTFSSFRPIVTSSAPCRDYLATTSLGAATACCTARRTIPSDQLVTRSARSIGRAGACWTSRGSRDPVANWTPLGPRVRLLGKNRTICQP